MYPLSVFVQETDYLNLARTNKMLKFAHKFETKWTAIQLEIYLKEPHWIDIFFYSLVGYDELHEYLFPKTLVF